MTDADLLDFIESFRTEYGFSPSVRELAEHFGLSLSTMHWHLSSLTKRGLAQREAGKPRTLRAS